MSRAGSGPVVDAGPVRGRRRLRSRRRDGQRVFVVVAPPKLNRRRPPPMWRWTGGLGLAALTRTEQDAHSRAPRIDRPLPTVTRSSMTSCAIDFDPGTPRRGSAGPMRVPAGRSPIATGGWRP